MRAETGLNEVALSGGVWQNMSLLKRTIPPLQAAGFTVYWHTVVPSNDGGLALGQAMIGARELISQLVSRSASQLKLTS